MADDLYSLKLSGKGLSMDREIPEQLATRIAVFVMSNGTSELGEPNKGNAKGAAQTPGSAPLPAGSSPQEYLQQSGARKAPQKITALGNYLIATQKGKSNFTYKELRQAFKDAREKIPANLYRDIATAVKAGWVASGSDDTYYVTGSGTAAISAQFPKSRKARKKRKKATKPK